VVPPGEGCIDLLVHVPVPPPPHHHHQQSCTLCGAAQVHNLTAALSINHNWFQAQHLPTVWAALERDWRDVESRIADCRPTRVGAEEGDACVDEEWCGRVQGVLRASSCLNVDGLLAACHLYGLRCLAAVAVGDEVHEDGACVGGAVDVRKEHLRTIPAGRARTDAAHLCGVLERALAHPYVRDRTRKDVAACCVRAAAACGLPAAMVAAAYGEWTGAHLRDLHAALAAVASRS